MTLPLPLRNRLADLILHSLHDAEARAGLEALSAVSVDARALGAGAPPDAFPADLFEPAADGLAVRSGFRAHEEELRARARRGWAVVRSRPLEPADPPLGVALRSAAALFDAGLYFEVHELLEPFWFRAEGDARTALQGLIQVAVGFQHLANGNEAGARALLHDGAEKLAGRALEGMTLGPFAAGVARALAAAVAGGFDWATVPPFPARVPP
jgi:DUF309 family protein family protein